MGTSIQTLQNYTPLNFVQSTTGDFNFFGTWTSGGSPVNFTGATAKMQVRRSALDPTKLIDFGNTAGTTLVLGGSAGTITAYAPASLLLTLNPGTYVWDLVVTTQGGVSSNYLAGAFTLVAGVSH